MKLIKIDPPGSFCHYEAVFDALKKCKGNSFLEVGCGAGDLSKKLCQRGFKGVGLDFSKEAIKQAEVNMKEYISSGCYQLLHDALDTVSPDKIEKADIALSMMVMEHVENDEEFIRQLSRFVKPGGYVMVAVPGRQDRWSIEDETVGHLRRYDRKDLQALMRKSGLLDINVWSISVPISNILFSLSDFMVKRSSEVNKIGQNQRTQTESSGIREIPFKTVFPSWCKLILNRITLYPFFVLQRFFYNTNFGLEMLGFGQVPDSK